MKKWFKQHQTELLISATCVSLLVASMCIAKNAIDENKKQKEQNPEWKSKLEEALLF